MPSKKQPKAKLRQPRYEEPAPSGRGGKLRWAFRLFTAWLLLPYALSLIYLIVPPASTLMMGDWLTGQSVERHWIPLSQMPRPLVSAVLTSEDSAFCSHWGLDINQMERSLKRAQKKDRPVRATSTVTQQTVKNLFFWPGRSWLRKLLEVPLAFWLEAVWSKERILETYLNIVQWGDGIYGVEAAARRHFGQSARALSPYQSALLATSLPNPIQRSAGHPGPGQKVLTEQLLGRMSKAAADVSCLRH